MKIVEIDLRGADVGVWGAGSKEVDLDGIRTRDTQIHGILLEDSQVRLRNSIVLNPSLGESEGAGITVRRSDIDISDNDVSYSGVSWPNPWDFSSRKDLIKIEGGRSTGVILRNSLQGAQHSAIVLDGCPYSVIDIARNECSGCGWNG